MTPEAWLLVGVLVSESGAATWVRPTVEFPDEASCLIAVAQAEGRLQAWRSVALVCEPAGE